jgi:hypothetical protein
VSWFVSYFTFEIERRLDGCTEEENIQISAGQETRQLEGDGTDFI